MERLPATASESGYDGESDEGRVYSSSSAIGVDALLTIRERQSALEPTSADAAAKLSSVSAALRASLSLGLLAGFGLEGRLGLRG